MIERTFVFALDRELREAVFSVLGAELESLLGDASSRTGLLEGLVSALTDTPNAPARREVPVTLRTTPHRVELEIDHGPFRDTLIWGL